MYDIVKISISMFTKLRRELKDNENEITTDTLYALIRTNFLFTRKETIIKTIKTIEEMGFIEQTENLGVWKINWKKVADHRRKFQYDVF